MFRGIRIALLFLALATPALAQKQVEIVSAIPVVGTGGQIGIGITQILNEVQKEREYRFSPSMGAQGDTAMLRAATLGKNTDIIFYGGVSTMSFNRIQNPTPGFDRDKDFTLSYGIGKNVFGIMVNPKSDIKNIDDLVAVIKSKPKSFFATTLTAPASIMMNDIFMKKYGLEGKVDQINYKTVPEITLALENREADYTVFTVPDMYNLKAVLVSSDQRLVTFPDAPTGKEIGFNDFNLSSILLFAVPKERGQLLKAFEADMKKVCSHPDFDKVAKLRAPYLSYCMEPKDTVATVKNELNLINKVYKQ